MPDAFLPFWTFSRFHNALLFPLRQFLAGRYLRPLHFACTSLTFICLAQFFSLVRPPPYPDSQEGIGLVQSFTARQNIHHVGPTPHYAIGFHAPSLAKHIRLCHSNQASFT
jgi:hypothetical protein